MILGIHTCVYFKYIYIYNDTNLLRNPIVIVNSGPIVTMAMPMITMRNCENGGDSDKSHLFKKYKS